MRQIVADMKQLDLLSETNFASESCESIGRASQSSTTSTTLTARNSKASNCSQGDFLANHIVKPGSSEAQAMTVRFGRKCCELLRKRDPITLWAKTLLESSTWNSTTCLIRWRAKTTPRKRLLFQLAPSMPDTGEIECGFSEPTLWQTPQVANATGGQTSRGGNRKNEQLLTGQVKLWPTPAARDFKGVSGAGRQKRKNYPADTLPNAVKLWPTPSATDNRDRGNLAMPAIKRRIAKGKQLNLSMVVSDKCGQLSPTWVEWLMGYPSGHTDCADSATLSCRKSPKK